MTGTSRLRGLPVFCFAFAGLLLGHAISYLLAVPDPLHRELVLQRTGHGYLPLASEAALLLLVAGVAAVVVRAWSRRRPDRTETIATIALVLAPAQVVAFAAQEVLERVVAGAPLDDLVANEHLLSIGILIQVAVALAGAVVLRWLARTSVRVAEVANGAGRLRLHRPALVSALPWPADRPLERFGAATPSVRAPPSV